MRKILHENSTLLKHAVVLFAFHISAAFCSENVFRQPDFHYASFYSVIEMAVMALGTSCERLWFEKVPLWERKAPVRGYAILGILYMASRFLSFYSMELIDFRTQVMWKNSKLPVTMLVRSMLLHAYYPARKYFHALLFVVALVFFTSGSSQMELKFDPTGVLVVLSALVADALLSNYQEKQMSMHGASTSEVLLQSSLAGLLVGTGASCTTILPAVRYVLAHRAALLWMLASSTLCFGGMKALMAVMQQQGTVVVSIVTSMRKVATVLLSFLVYGHQSFHQNHAVGLGFLILGMALSHWDTTYADPYNCSHGTLKKHNSDSEDAEEDSTLIEIDEPCQGPVH